MTAVRRKSAKPIDPYRRTLYGKIEVAKVELGLDDEAYRDILRSRFGKESRKSLGNAQLVDLIEHFKSLGFKPKSTRPPKRAGSRPMAKGPEPEKIRALWLSLWHLGVVADPSEAALAAFVKRVTGGKDKGVDALQWLDGRAATKVIEGLKAVAVREAGVNWGSYSAGYKAPVIWLPRARVLEAQWRLLHGFGDIASPDLAAMALWATERLGEPATPEILETEAADLLIQALGDRIRARLRLAGARTLREWREKAEHGK